MKKETLEEVAREYSKRGQFGLEKAVDTERAFLFGGLWAAKNLYSEKDVLDLLVKINAWPTTFDGIEDIAEWFQEFRKENIMD